MGLRAWRLGINFVRYVENSKRYETGDKTESYFDRGRQRVCSRPFNQSR